MPVGDSLSPPVPRSPAAAPAAAAPAPHGWRHGLALLPGLLIGRQGWLATVLAWLVVLLIAARLAAPPALRAVINHRLAEPGAMQGHLDDLSLSLVSGSMHMTGLHVHATAVPPDAVKPVLDIDHLTGQISWSSLVSGRIQGSVALSGVSLYVIPLIPIGGAAAERRRAAEAEHPQPTPSAPPLQGPAWRSLVTSVIPFRIAAITVADAHLIYTESRYHVQVQVASLDMIVSDLLMPDPVADPAQLRLQGRTMGGGALSVQGRMWLLPSRPHADLRVALDHLDLPSLDELTSPYQGLCFATGSFSAYAEEVLDGTTLDGFIKPIFTNLRVRSYQDQDGDEAFSLFWKVVVPVAAYILENGHTGSQAARIPLHGQVQDPGTDLWTVIGSALSNAFLHAIAPGFGGLQPQHLSPTP